MDKEPRAPGCRPRTCLRKSTPLIHPAMPDVSCWMTFAAGQRQGCLGSSSDSPITLPKKVTPFGLLSQGLTPWHESVLRSILPWQLPPQGWGWDWEGGTWHLVSLGNDLACRGWGDGRGALALSSPRHVQKPEMYVQLMPGALAPPPTVLYELPESRNCSFTCLVPTPGSEERPLGVR